MKGAKSPLRVQSSSFLNFLSSENWTAAGRKDFFDTLKKPPQPELGRLFYDRAGKPGSVLTVIYLGAPLPVRSSHLLGDSRASLVSSAVLLRIEFTATDAFTRRRVSSYLAFPPFPEMRSTSGGISLLHFSSDRSGRALPVILALRSPDFPHARPFGTAPATVRPGRANIVTDDGGFVKPDCIFFFQRL